MHHRSPFAYGRIAKALAFLTLSCALAAPAAYASKKAPTKKQTTAASAPVKKKQTAKATSTKKVVAQKNTKSATSNRKVVATRAVKSNTKVARKATATRAVAAAAAGAAAVAVARPSFGQMAGLHQVSDPLDLKSSVALVLDQDTKEVLLSKNDHAVLPIASITKLMT
ncbi:MAG: D-alanyl-D-alanine carboxypeptidase, partial [Comamonas sp.]|nr:D-alanyl-D-alanine carboxypeptidase [Comamonas sp.]